jgi:hypothetical protein
MSDSSEAGLRNEVLHRHHQGETQRHIARQLGISRWKVSNIIDGYLQDRDSTIPTAPEPRGLERPPRKCGSKLDAFEPQLRDL